MSELISSTSGTPYAINDTASMLRAKAMLLNAETKAASRKHDVGLKIAAAAARIGSNEIASSILAKLAEIAIGVETQPTTTEAPWYFASRIARDYDLSADDVRRIAETTSLTVGEDVKPAIGSYSNGTGVNQNCWVYSDSGLSKMRAALEQRAATKLRRNRRA